MAFHDNYPVTKGHLLIVPKRHVWEYFDLYQAEINAVHELLVMAKLLLQSCRTQYNWFYGSKSLLDDVYQLFSTAALFVLFPTSTGTKIVSSHCESWSKRNHVADGFLATNLPIGVDFVWAVPF